MSDGVVVIGMSLALAGMALAQALIWDIVFASLLLILSGWKPQWAAQVTVFLLPFAPVEMSFGRARFSLVEIAILATFIGAGLLFARRVLGVRQLCPVVSELARIIKQTRFSVLALALMALGTATLGTLAEPQFWRESVREWRWTVAEPSLWYFAALYILRSRESAQRIVQLWIAGAASSSALLLFNWFQGGGVSVEGVRRLVGFYSHPNAAALALERPLMLVLGLLSASFISSPRIAASSLPPPLETGQIPYFLFWSLSAGLIGSATLLTFSRGAIVALLITLTVAVWWRGRRGLAFSLIATGAILVALATLLFPARFQAGLIGAGASLRVTLWQSALAMIRDYPITGVGLDQFLYQYAPRYVSALAWDERFTSHPHNLLLDVWLRLGNGGLILVGVAIWLVWRVVREKLNWPIDYVVTLALLCGALHGLLDRFYFTHDLAMAFWVAAVILDLPRASQSAVRVSRG